MRALLIIHDVTTLNRIERMIKETTNIHIIGKFTQSRHVLKAVKTMMPEVNF
ncbi:chemotaxis response regulator CheB [Cerasibacillus quisquiliarum]|uniref:Uncharacterized protein n=1 Tax=Cerasibacillus quisquiliarum TaxID=227865 RepID=A0A511UU77_9BACI|nr:hypothetical protein [Cerasibacillus quisquiliarum]MBB5144948.1 chemotaxis response regulator CheB [Cerasibacillus quisquiliarum]GEN30156.1 hypothetical protein CQU01_03940 [Cerasibacillus quisquiliarum]